MSQCETKQTDSAAFAVAQLRHLYQQMLDGHVVDTAAAARGLLGPSIERLEKAVPTALPEDVERDVGRVREAIESLASCAPEPHHTATAQDAEPALSRLATAAARVPGLEAAYAALERDVNAEIDDKLALRKELGATVGETYPMFVRRLASERDDARQEAATYLLEVNSLQPRVATLTARVAELEQERDDVLAKVSDAGKAMEAKVRECADTMVKAEARATAAERREGVLRSALAACVEYASLVPVGHLEHKRIRAHSAALAALAYQLPAERPAAGDARVKELTARVAELEQEKTALLNMEPMRLLREAEARATAAEAKVRELEGPVRAAICLTSAVHDLRDVGHSGDEETGQHDEGCDGCRVDTVKAMAEEVASVQVALSKPTPAPGLRETVGPVVEYLRADVADSRDENPADVLWSNAKTSVSYGQAFALLAAYDAATGGAR